MKTNKKIKILSFVHPTLKFVICCFCFLLLIGNYSLLIESGNWYQQFMPNLGGKQITDVTFLDSLNGYAVATQTSDSSYILKTTNRGDNWLIIHRQLFAMTHIQFFNVDTGYAGGGYLYKTIDGGFNWSQINTPASTVEDMYVLNDSTIWFVNSNGLVGGVYYTSNGGGSWTRQLDLGSLNPEKIYMFNARIGFITKSGGAPYIRKTTNSGSNWPVLINGEYFNDMYFIDSLIGWRSYGSFMKKTTNGGLNWISQQMPFGGQIITSTIGKFSVLNNDTIWGVGGQIFYGGSQTRGIIYRTIDGGNNWRFQAPDTAYNIFNYYFIKFVNKNVGWAYTTNRGVHTIVGGDLVWLLGIKQISSEIPKEFKLFQNYPNPFNPVTNIKYQIVNQVKSQKSKVKIIIYDVTGKEVIKLVDEEQSAGTYEVDFSGKNYSSGIYFYTLIVNNKIINTKKMLMLK